MSTKSESGRKDGSPVGQYCDQERKEFNRIYKEVDDLYHEIARKLALSDSAFDILYTMCELGDGCLQRDICQISFISKQTINSSIRKLEREGYLTLRPGKGRDMHLFLTEQGRRAVDEKICPVMEMEREAFFGMEAEQRQLLLALTRDYMARLREGAQLL